MRDVARQADHLSVEEEGGAVTLSGTVVRVSGTVVGGTGIVFVCSAGKSVGSQLVCGDSLTGFVYLHVSKCE